MTQTKRYLSDIKQGEQVVILKVKGYGAFRKRITEMGFIRGSVVKVIKKSPLQDPIEYELLNYRVSLRESEAKLIEVISVEDSLTNEEETFNASIAIDEIRQYVRGKEKEINVALVGNPNCGKTTLFNLATDRREKVGNYGGVTVDLKTASVKSKDYDINITDLPGTYSMSEFSPEELYVREHLKDTMPDVVINVVDASNIERNLFLTTQLIDMNIRVIIVLNMYDELEKRGDTLNHELLSELLGCPIVPMVATKKVGLDDLTAKIVDVYEGRDKSERHIHISYGRHINNALERLNVKLKDITAITDRYHSRYVAIKLLEGDSQFTSFVGELEGGSSIIAQTEKEIKRLESEFKEKSETLITDAKYSFVRGALKETYHLSQQQRKIANYGADILLTNKWLGFPVFFFVMWAMFQLTFSLGSYPMGWIETGVEHLSAFLQNNMAEGMLKHLLIDGIIGGVGGVIIFLPNILILFFCISFMEDTGYMARAAFIMDKIMHRIGLHGKSFIPLLMSFGCNVPAIMATRTLENRKDRIITMLIIPFMSCSARLPVYILLTSIFFVNHQGLILLSLYGIGIVIASLVALAFNKILFNKEDVPFVMELPPYRTPSMHNTLIHMWQKSVQYLSKMGGIILIASIIIWALGHFPTHTDYSQDYDQQMSSVATNANYTTAEIDSLTHIIELEKESERLAKSYIGQIGHAMEPVIRPLGFDWKIGVSLVSGLAAKEIVVSTMSVLYHSEDDDNVGLNKVIREDTHTAGVRKGEKVYSPLVAYILMLFILIYFPCIAVIAAIKREAGWRWATFTMIYTTGVAWLVCFVVYQVGSLFM